MGQRNALTMPTPIVPQALRRNRAYYAQQEQCKEHFKSDQHIRLSLLACKFLDEWHDLNQLYELQIHTMNQPTN